MPIYFDDLANERKSIPVTWREHTINVQYNPNDLSPSMIRKFSAVQNRVATDEADADDISWLAETAELLVADWDMYQSPEAEKRGEKWPITQENLNKLPVGLLADMVRLIIEDISPAASPKASESPSGATSAGRTFTKRPAKSR